MSAPLVAVEWQPRVRVEETALVREDGLDPVAQVEFLDQVRDTRLYRFSLM